MEALRVENLCKRYGSVTGVEGVSFAVKAGEIFGYLGPNGSGKTTTIRCIMGLLRPSSGSCFVLDQRVLAGKATKHSRVGYLPGDFRIWSHLSARKALGMLASLGNTADVRSRQEQLAQRLELDLDRQCGDLSKGNRQKVGLLYAFGHSPELLILDEPTIGLDPLVRQTVLELIREAADGGATVLLSSHDLAEVSAVCGRAAILREGRLVELSPISQILEKGERHLRVWFAEGAVVGDLTKTLPSGSRIIGKDSGVIEIAYHGPADGVIKWISNYSVDRISTPETSLEEAFIHYYRGDPGGES